MTPMASFKRSASASGAIFRRRTPHPETIATVSFKIRVPRVILLVLFDRLPKKEVKFTRHNIFERDRNTCQYCGGVYERKDLNLDHVIPRDRGGPTTWENIVCSCIRCNTQKANRTPQEAGMHLVRKPKRPEMASVCAGQFGRATRQLEAFPGLGLLERRTGRGRGLIAYFLPPNAAYPDTRRSGRYLPPPDSAPG